MNATQLLSFLNSIRVGQFDTILVRLGEARTACEGLGEAELAGIVREAEDAVRRGDLKTYRKRIETAVARLGHLR